MDLLFHPQHIHKMDKCCFPGTHELLVCLAPYKKGNKIKSLCIRDNFGDLYNVDYLSEMVPQAHSNRVENGHVTAATIFILLSLFFIHLLNSRLIKVIPNKREREREREGGGEERDRERKRYKFVPAPTHSTTFILSGKFATTKRTIRANILKL